MPELPEVETTRQGIIPHTVGKKVRRVVVRNPAFRWPIPEDLPEKVARKTLKSVSRRGKYLLFEFSQGYILWHLGMSGSLRIVKPEEPPLVHDHVDMEFAHCTLRFCDPRRFGCVLWSNDPYQHRLLASLGPEPLSEAFDKHYLKQVCAKRKVAIKQLVMNAQVVVGVGNIYANEALFYSGIHPLAPANTLSLKRLEKLVVEIKKVLDRAIRKGGTTLRDFVSGDGKPGYFAQSLRVYGRAGQKCNECSGVLQEVRLGQRSTVFCARCQKK